MEREAGGSHSHSHSRSPTQRMSPRLNRTKSRTAATAHKSGSQRLGDADNQNRSRKRPRRAASLRKLEETEDGALFFGTNNNSVVNDTHTDPLEDSSKPEDLSFDTNSSSEKECELDVPSRNNKGSSTTTIVTFDPGAGQLDGAS